MAGGEKAKLLFRRGTAEGQNLRTQAGDSLSSGRRLESAPSCVLTTKGKTMESKDACLILDLIGYATDGNWNNTRDGLTEAGYSGREVADSVGRLAEIAHRTNPISAEDF